MNISSTTDGETSFTLRIHKTSNRRTISAHKTRKGRTKEIVHPSFKTSTIPNIPNMPNIHCHHIINTEKEAKCILSPILDSNHTNNNNYKDDRYIVLPRDKKRNKVTFADQIKTVTVLPVIVQSVNESANIESIHKDKDKDKDNNNNNDKEYQKEKEKEKQRSNSMDNKTRNKNHNQHQRHQSSQQMMSFRNTRVNYKSSLVKEEAQCNGCIVY